MIVSKKSKEQMYREYANGTRDKNKIVEEAHKAIKEKSLKKFKTNPTTRIGKRGYKLIYIPQVGWKKYHHYVWEQAGNSIPKNHHIHHNDEGCYL